MEEEENRKNNMLSQFISQFEKITNPHSLEKKHLTLLASISSRIGLKWETL